MPENKNIIRILSLIIAVLLWIYVMGEVDPETKAKISDINLAYANTETLTDKGLAIAQDGSADKISAVIKGKRTYVNDIKNSGITASLDVSKCREGKNNVDVVLNVPSGISVVSLSKEKITVKVEEIVWQEKPVKVRLFDYEEESGEKTEKIPWITSVGHEAMTVSGAESSVEKTVMLKGNVSAKAATENGTRVMVNLTPVDKNGNRIYGIELDKARTGVEIQLLDSKQVKLDIAGINLSSKFKIDEIADATVKIVGTPEALESVDSLYAEADLSEVSKAGKVEISPEIQSLPYGIYLFDAKAPSVSISIKSAE